MHNRGDDKELDRISREAAVRYAPPGAPDWNALSAELDKVMPVKEKKRRIALLWWLLPALLLGGSIYWFTQTHERSTQPNTPDAEATTVTAPASKQPAPADVSVQQPVAPQPESTTTATREKTSHSRGTTDLSIRKTKTTVGRNASSFIPGGSSALQNSAVVTVLPSTQAPVVQQTTKESAASSSTDQNATNTETEKTSATSPAVEIKTEPAIASNDSARTENRKTTTQSLLPSRGKGFSIAALAGVDESTVKFKYGNEVGYNVGATIGYHFNNRFSIHTGAIYTQKNYKMAGADFHAPKGSWASYYKLQTVEGYCRMWELPLLARYTVSQGKRSSVFLSTGLSSYFMTNEQYEYEYFNNAGALMTRNMGYSSTNSHVLSILHLSAGFENRMSRSLSLLIEPYAKLPLGGVGLGSIRLSSFGLNFAVQYRQPAKK